MRFWIVTPRGQFAPVMGELRPSRESAERFLALGLTDQRRPLYEVLEVELLRADALGSSNNKNEEAKAPDMGDWPPSGVGTETGNNSQGGRGSEALDASPESSGAAPDLQGATERDPPPRGAAKLHPVLQGAGQGPNDVHRPLEQNNKQEEDLLEGEDQRPENQERIFLDPFDRRALPPGAGPLRAGPEGGRPTTGQPEQTELEKRTGS